MKACLMLQRRFSIMGHAIACLLKEKYGINEFCGYTYLRSAEKFLKFQKDIQYQPLLVEEDLYQLARKEPLDLNYIKFLEKEYGVPFLWPCIATDRHFMMSWPKYDYSDIPICSHEEMLKHLQVRFKAVIKMLEEVKPNFIIFPNIGAMGNNVLYYVAKKMGIKTISIAYVRAGNRVTVTDNCFDQFIEINRTFDFLQNGKHQGLFRDKAVKFLEEFRTNPCFSLLLNSTDLIRKEKEKFSLLFWPFRVGYNILRYLVYYVGEAKWKDRRIEDPLSFFRNRLKKHLRKWRRYGNLFEKVRENEDFAFFPLHQEPEITTLLWAPFYTNQIALIQNIAKSLPVHFKLYVKEHPAMLNYRSMSYYKKLKKIPNVRLIDTKVPSISLIKKSKIVLTITGTAGWEAALLKKPVINFGSVFYNKLSAVKRSGNIEELPKLIKQSLENYQPSEQELINFLSAIFESSLPLNYEYLWQDASFEGLIKDKEFKNFVDFLAKKLNLKPAD